jgi:hypothetical protein
LISTRRLSTPLATAASSWRSRFTAPVRTGPPNVTPTSCPVTARDPEAVAAVLGAAVFRAAAACVALLVWLVPPHALSPMAAAAAKHQARLVIATRVGA